MKKYVFLILTISGFTLISCNNSGEKAAEAPTENKDTIAQAAAVPKPPAAVPFQKEVSYGQIKFAVSSAGTETNNQFTLTPSGLKNSNDAMTESIQGKVKDVLVDDIDGDNSPEVCVVVQSGPDDNGKVYVYSANNGKSLSMVNLKALPNEEKINQGYKGHDEFAFVEGSFIRRFPLYEGDTKTAKMRQLQFKLKPGEAMKQLVLDKTVEF
jgi:dipeptidyl aminopeptidase/acylaminoacyl peptidase